jgi:hypothetical protein
MKRRGLGFFTAWAFFLSSLLSSFSATLSLQPAWAKSNPSLGRGLPKQDADAASVSIEAFLKRYLKPSPTQTNQWLWDQQAFIRDQKGELPSAYLTWWKELPQEIRETPWSLSLRPVSSLGPGWMEWIFHGSQGEDVARLLLSKKQLDVLRFYGRGEKALVQFDLHWVSMQQPEMIFQQLTSEQLLSYAPLRHQREILSSKSLSLLSPVGQTRYLEKLGQLLVQYEQISTGEGHETSLRESVESNKLWWWRLLVGEEAWAQTQQSCVVAGWPGEWYQGRCRPAESVRKQAYSSGSLICNPMVFGSNGLSFPGKQVPSDATFQCYQKTKSQNAWTSAVQAAKKSGQSWDVWKASVEKQIQEITSSHCSSPRSSSQKKACDSLGQYWQELNSMTCEHWPKSAESSKPQLCPTDLMAVVEPPAISPDSLLSTKMEPSSVLSPSGLRCGRGDLIGLPMAASALECGLSSPVKSVECQDEIGEVKQVFYCECSSQTLSEYRNSNKPVACREKPSTTRVSAEEKRKTERTTRKKNEPWLKPQTAVLLAAAVGLGLWYWNHKQTMKMAYSYLNPPQPSPPVPPPGLQPVVPTPPPNANPPPPTDRGREPPSGVQ